MNRPVLYLALGLCVSSVRADTPRQTLETGTRAYQEKQFGVAQQAFATAARNATDEKLDPAVAHYNEAAADYRLGRLDEAAQRLAEALRTGDLHLQQQAWYNRGNALLRQMTTSQQQGKLDAAKELVKEAEQHYEQAILLDPDDRDAKMNYELCWQLEQKLEQQKQQQEQQKPDQQKESQQKKDRNKQDQHKQNQQQKQDSGQDQKQPSSPQPKPDPKQQQSEPTQARKKDGEMTPEEAAMLLDAMRQEEQANRDKMRLNIGQSEPVEKDW